MFHGSPLARGLLVCGVVAALFLAGCSAGPGPEDEKTGNVVVLDDDGTTSYVLADGTGALHGTVQDDAGTPVVGATVLLLGANISGVKTSVVGKFEFTNVTAGSFTLRVDHPEYRPTEEPVTVKAGAASKVIVFLLPLHDVGPGYRPHLHDYWGDATEKVVIDRSFEWHEPYDDSGPVAEYRGRYYDTVTHISAHPCVWTDSEDEVYFNNRQIWFDDPAQLVWAGTSEIQVVLQWAPQDYVGEQLILAWKSADSTKYVEGEYFDKGTVYSIPVAPGQWDSSHQTFSLWDFFICSAKASSEQPRNVLGSVDVDMKIVRGHPIVPESPHPFFWANGSVVPVIQAQEVTFSNTAVYTSRSQFGNGEFVIRPGEGVLVPPGTQRLQATLSWSYSMAVNEKPWSLTYRPANVYPYTSKDPADLVKPAAAETAPNSRVYDIAVKPEETDAFYQKVSNWVFFLNFEGEEDDWKWANPCGCSITVTLTVEAHKDPAYA